MHADFIDAVFGTEVPASSSDTRDAFYGVLGDSLEQGLICDQLCRKFTDDEDFIQRELQNALPRVQCLELTIDHMTGKLVNES